MERVCIINPIFTAINVLFERLMVSFLQPGEYLVFIVDFDSLYFCFCSIHKGREIFLNYERVHPVTKLSNITLHPFYKLSFVIE